MLQESKVALAIALSPLGHLYLDKTDQDQEAASPAVAEQIESCFKDGHQAGLLKLGLNKFSEPLPQSLLFWQKFSGWFITHVCHSPEITEQSKKLTTPVPSEQELQELILQAPFFKGYEYLNEQVLATLWNDLHEAFEKELAKFSTIKELLNAYNASWNLVGRICFHLAENKNNPDTPFAFLATYTTRLSAEQALKHVPLGRALQEYAGEKNKSALLALLLPVQKAAADSPFIKELINSGEIFQPLAWSAKQAHTFLKDIALFESCGIVVRVPNWWNVQKPPRPQVTISIGKDNNGDMNLHNMLDFNVHFALGDGQELSPDEWQEILNSTEPLIKVKGQWVQADSEKLKDVLAHWKKIQQQVTRNGLTFAQGMQMLAGSPLSASDGNDASEHIREWSHIQAGNWLKETLQKIGNPDTSTQKDIDLMLNTHLHATLRPYQTRGVQWLWLLYTLRLGGCLADDMGLGKTIQVISLLLLIKHQQKNNKPHLLIVPASLLGNWQTELKRFAPSLIVKFMHPSCDNNFKEVTADELIKHDLTITTYGSIVRLPCFTETSWDVIILDEAQTIKNAQTKQTRAVKELKSNVRLVLTGTPIENRLSDLWSLFDFFAPGLLGSLKDFGAYAKKANDKNDATKLSHFYSSLRSLTNPYILRRLKTDKRIITDLPDKTEIPAFCALSKEQVTLYQQAVEELKQQLTTSDGIQRKGLIFNYLMRFKQICNHPSQWLGYGTYQASESGKFLRIKEICEQIAAKQEKVLIFTQFQEIIPALSHYLSTIFNREGLILHGGTPIKKRSELVQAFSHEQGPPFFVLSLKAGGTGLNLTSASHVIHFDRWWNPAVENQATDRAYRIGQKKNVMVYKFICQGTIEEKIDNLIASKKLLAGQILEAGNELSLTQLTNEELMNIVSLDIHKAFQEN